MQEVIKKEITFVGQPNGYDVGNKGILKWKVKTNYDQLVHTLPLFGLYNVNMQFLIKGIGGDFEDLGYMMISGESSKSDGTRTWTFQQMADSVNDDVLKKISLDIDVESYIIKVIAETDEDGNEVAEYDEFVQDEVKPDQEPDEWDDLDEWNDVADVPQFDDELIDLDWEDEE